MATKRKISSTTSPTPSNRARIISPEEVEKFDYDDSTKTAYIEEMGGSVYYRDTKAGIPIRIFEAEDQGEQLRAMANFVAKANCDEEGELIYASDEDVLSRLTSSAIMALAVGIAKASQNAREEREKRGKGDRGGNVSRR